MAGAPMIPASWESAPLRRKGPDSCCPDGRDCLPWFWFAAIDSFLLFLALLSRRERRPGLRGRIFRRRIVRSFFFRLSRAGGHGK